jgi:hypothetical protein
MSPTYGHDKLSKRSPFASRTWSDVKHLTRFAQDNTMPHAARHYECLPRSHLNDGFAAIFLQNDINVSGDQEKNLVRVWMHFAPMRCIACHERGAHYVAINPRRGPGFPRDETGSPVPIQPEKRA